MNRPPLHLARPGQLPAPVTGDDSLDILSQAIESLAQLRTAYWPGDSAVHLHALASLIAQAQQLLPRAVADARGQQVPVSIFCIQRDLQIRPFVRELLNPTAATAARRYRNKP